MQVHKVICIDIGHIDRQRGVGDGGTWRNLTCSGAKQVVEANQTLFDGPCIVCDDRCHISVRRCRIGIGHIRIFRTGIAIDALLKARGADLDVQHIGIAQRSAGSDIAKVFGQNSDRGRSVKRCRRRKRQSIQSRIQTADRSRDNNRTIGCSVADGECQSDNRTQRHRAIRRCQRHLNRTARCIDVRYLNRIAAGQGDRSAHRSYLGTRHDIHRRVVDCIDCN